MTAASEPVYYVVPPGTPDTSRHHKATFLGLIWMAGRCAEYYRHPFRITTDWRWFVEVQVFGRYVGVCWG